MVVKWIIWYFVYTHKSILFATLLIPQRKSKSQPPTQMRRFLKRQKNFTDAQNNFFFYLKMSGYRVNVII